MSLACHFNSCQWSGLEDEIFEHIETQHRKYMRQPKGTLYFDFSLEDLQQTAFIMCSQQGLYWLKQNQQQLRKDGIDFGVFHIGGSEPVAYTLKLGLNRDGHCEYWGPYHSEPDNMLASNSEGKYNLKFDFDSLETFNLTMPSRRLRLYFGEYDDSDDQICPGPEDIEWTEEDESLNRWAVEKFTCPVCLNYIRRDARFCENKHFICLSCFDKINTRNKLKCPSCRGQYLHDCADNDLERLLRMIKWPDNPVQTVDTDLLDYLRSLPNFSCVKVKPGEKL